VVSATLPEALLTQLPEVIEQHASEIARLKRTSAFPLYMGQERLLVVAAPFAGEAGAQHAYYVLMTKKSPESDPWVLLSSTSSDDLKWGKFPWLPLGGGIIAVIAIGLILQRKEVDGPLHRLRDEVHHMAKQELHKIDDTKYGGKLGGIARDINATIEHFTHAPIPKSETAKKDISAILDPKAAASADGKSFDVSQPAPGKPAVLAPAAMAASLFGTPKAAPGLGGSAPPLPSVPSPAPSLAPLVPTPASRAPQLPGAQPPAIPFSSARMGKQATAEPDEEDQAHFRQVYDEYVEFRLKCGESIAGLSLDKFTAKLKSNREQLMSKHGCRTARFTVYEKDGKAAIRAVPVKG